MSQASRDKALAPVRIREQVARELAANIVLVKDGGRFRASDSVAVYRRDDVSRWARRMLGGGLTFDVHAAREHARSLVALEAEQTAFEDWTRAQGLGPENREPGAFVCRECRGYGGGRGDGWTWSCVQCTSRPHLSVHVDRGGWPGKLARQWGGDSRAPMGRSLARLGRHILAALDGQPSECQECKAAPTSCMVVTASGGRSWVSEGQRAVFMTDAAEAMRTATTLGALIHATCPDCQGTGHNLAGRLPAVEATPQLRRKVRESLEGDRESWAWSIETGGLTTYTTPRGIVTATRVTARGEHRNGMAHQFGPLYFSDAPLDVKIESRGWRSDLESGGDPWGDPWMHRDDRMPGWRLGELKHAEQRRVKAARSFGDDARRSVAVLQREERELG